MFSSYRKQSVNLQSKYKKYKKKMKKKNSQDGITPEDKH